MPSSLLRNWTISTTGIEKRRVDRLGIEQLRGLARVDPEVVTDPHQVLEGTEIERGRDGVDRDVPRLGQRGIERVANRSRVSRANGERVAVDDARARRRRCCRSSPLLPARAGSGRRSTATR